MPRRDAETRQHLRAVSLFIGSSFSDAWESIVLPWFRRVALASLEIQEPIAVVVPFASAASRLRARLVEEPLPLLGVEFITPPQLRELVLRDGADTPPLREHLRLLLAIAAESIAESDSRNTDLTAIARSIFHSPDNLLRVFDQLGAAGWSFDELSLKGVRSIASRFRGLVENCGFQLVHEADRAALETASARPARFNELLLIGFTAADWSLWPLLQSAVISAERATIVLEYPREQTRAADELWIGSWEQEFGPANDVGDGDHRRPFAHLVETAANEAGPRVAGEVKFLVGFNITEQAEAILAATLEFLSDDNCGRMGILFPQSGPLPRLVSELLGRAGVPHDDSIGHLAPGEFEQPAWNAWLDLQENHQLEVLLRFFALNPPSLEQLPFDLIRDKLRRAYRNILIDDLEVLREHCARSTEDRTLVAIAKLLQDVSFLPARTTLKMFLAETRKSFAALKWNDRWATIEQFAQQWSDRLEPELPRRIFLRWLKEIANSFTSERNREGDHRYSRVHLLPYAEAEAHQWSHLILAGLNQGEWPPTTTESGFLPEKNIAALNARAAQVGKQGEGHLIVEKGKTFLLGSQDARRIALRRFVAAIESVTDRLAVTASLIQESAPERFWNPSELFSQLYFATNNRPLSQPAMSRLREETHAWLEKEDLLQFRQTAKSDVVQTRAAYDQRRKPDVPFGEYEFSLREPIRRQITLRATEWDKVVKTPALIWLKKYLGVENQEPDMDQWTTAIGTWVHDWLAKIGSADQQNTFVNFPSSVEIRDRSALAAHDFRKHIGELCAAAGRPVPDWWTSGWGNAFALTSCLASKLAEVENCPQLATEWRLESPQTISLNRETTLRLSGRIDLILARAELNDSQLADADLWIVDYKTGGKKALTITGKTPELRLANLRKRLVRGDAIQLGLYGMAARQLGAAHVELSILSWRTDLDQPQLSFDQLEAQTDFWAELARMQDDGVFGLRGLIRSDFGFNPDYPLAILPIDKEFLDEKWALTHPALADDEDDWS